MEQRNDRYLTRVSWIDDCKMFAMCSVIIGHVMAMFFKDLIGSDSLGRIFISYSMYLFVFISAYCNYNALLRVQTFETLLKYLKKIFYRIVVPGLFMTLLSYIADREIHFFTHYWFLFMLAIVLALSAICRYLLRNAKNNIPFYSLLFLFLLCIPFENVNEFSFIFVVGLLYRKYEEKANGIMNSWTSRSILFLIWAVTFIYTKDVNFYTHYVIKLFREGMVYIFPLRQLCAFASVLLIVSLFQLKRNYNLFSYWGGYTLPIYTIHCFILLYIVNPILKSLEIESSWIVCLSLSLIVLLLTCTVIKLIQKNKISRLLLMGER